MGLHHDIVRREIHMGYTSSVHALHRLLYTHRVVPEVTFFAISVWQLI